MYFCYLESSESIQGLLQHGHITRFKNFKTPFFWRYLKFLPLGNWYWSRTSPKNFFWKYLKKYRCYALAKFWHKKGRGRHISCATTKIFSPINHRLVGNKWWKFQKDILNGFWVIDHFVQIDCMLMACSSKFGLFHYRSRP